MANKIVKRNEVDEKFKWAIQDIYVTDTAWEHEYVKVNQMIDEIKKYEGHLTENADKFFEFLNLYEEGCFLFERVTVYANQRYHEDTANSVYQNLTGKAANLGVKLESATSFAIPEILSTDPTVIQTLFNEKPELKKYENFISNIMRMRDHTLSKELEELIAMAGEVMDGASNIFSMFNNADVRFPEIKDEEGNNVRITHGRYVPLLESKDRSVRAAAFHGMYDTYKQFKNTLAATYNTNVKSWIFETKARNYNSNMERALDATNVPTSVYKNLIEAVHENMHLMHRYVTLRKKFLGVDELHMYDVYVPMVGDVDMKIPFEEAKKTVYDALAPLVDDYRSILKEVFDNGWIDVYENEGKRT